MRFDPQCGYTVETDALEASAPADAAASNSSAGRAIACVAVILTALLGAWIWRQQMPRVQGAHAAETLPDRPIGDSAQNPAAIATTANDRATDAEQAAVHAATNTSIVEQTPADDYAFEINYQDGSQIAQSNLVLEQGKEQLAVGRTARAIELLREALRLNPESAEAHYNLGLAYVLRGDMRAAKRERDLLRDLDRNLSNLLGNLVR